MQAKASPEQAKAELDAVLNSGWFAHAPGLAQFLAYVGSKCLEGQANHIKEYNIAVEALGRPADFDQKRDSIVRVEAHRLRKRLRQYYEGDGAGHALQILIPPGQYVPQFVYREDAPAALTETADEEESAQIAGANGHSLVAGVAELTVEPVTVEPRKDNRPFKPVLRWLAAAALVAAILAIWQLAPRGRSIASADKSDNAGLPIVAPRGGEEIRILAGANTARYVDRFGNTWTSDRYYHGGAVFSTPAGYKISGTQDPAIFQSRREGTFSYDIPLEPGIYEMHLYFAETLFGEGNIAGGGETYRIFDVSANGKTLTSGLDVIADAPGSNTADVKVYKNISPDRDGLLHLKFAPGIKEKPFLNAIEILPGIPDRLRPVRIVARATSVNARGGLWSADRYFTGGQNVLRADPVKGTPDPDLYKGERFGNFSYTIPAIARGHYTVRLHFAESWFGPQKPAGGGAGDRIFDVHCNGTALVRNFDIFKEAGGSDRALDKVFHGVEANTQGKIVLSFVPVVNYACVNAIEVVDEGK
jgi:hypothetical protein